MTAIAVDDDESKLNKNVEDVEAQEGRESRSSAVVDTDTEEQNDSASPAPRRCLLMDHPWLYWGLTLLFSATASGVILGFGISAARKEQTDRFDRVSHDLLQQFEASFDDFVVSGLWLQQATLDRKQTRAGFRTVYDYIRSSGLEIIAGSWVRNVTHSERESMENETRTYFADHYPDEPYFGFLGLEYSDDFIEPHPGPRSNQSFYFPLRFVEPMEDPLVRSSIDLDMWSLPPHREALSNALNTWLPTTTERLKLPPEYGDDAYFVIIMHPGVQTPSNPEPRDLSAVAFRIKEAIAGAQISLAGDEEVSLYIFDSTTTTSSNEQGAPFLGAAKFLANDRLEYILENAVGDITGQHSMHIERVIPIASREWTFVVGSENESFEPSVGFAVFGASMVFVACFGLAFWLYTANRRASKLSEMKRDAESERTALLIENSNRIAERERELNDFISHEVRNPLSAALSACSFVSTEIHKSNPLQDAKTRKSVREDLAIVNQSLEFINDLLRSMLDYHRATNRQMKIKPVPTDILRDVLEPTATMLYNRSDNFEILVDCPENLVIMTDGLRLKQITLNLARNSAKFVSQGFIRFRAIVADDGISLAIEDSGCGIPESKRDQLFQKWQETLDSLSQGTGVGLSLCKSLAELLGGDLWLDTEYDSGVDGFPGTRFVVDLKTLPMTPDQVTEYTTTHESSFSHPATNVEGSHSDIPEELYVLLVEDNLMLRKLFRRTVEKSFPKWKIDEAANGETSLKMVDSKSYNVIFMDQYMASTDKQLLGTETVRALRAKDVDSIICGLSANDLERQFLEAGSNCFLMKPFPTQSEVLRKEISRILSSKSFSMEDDPTSSKITVACESLGKDNFVSKKSLRNQEVNALSKRAGGEHESGKPAGETLRSEDSSENPISEESSHEP